MKRIVAGLCALIIAASSQAVTKYWVPGNVGSFTTGANWNGGTIPASNDTLYINSGAANMDSYTNYASALNLMRTSTPQTAYLNLNNSRLETAGTSYIGYGATNTTAALSLTNSSLLVKGAGTFYVGHSGQGMTNVLNLKNSSVDMSSSATAGNLIMSGVSSRSVLNMDNSTLSMKGGLSAGASSGNLSLVSLAGGSVLTITGNLNAGNTSGGTGVVTVANNSSMTIGGNTLIGQAAGSYGQLNINGGSVTGGTAWVGNQSSGDLNMNGGKLTLTGGLVLGQNNSLTGSMTASNAATISIGTSMTMGSATGSVVGLTLSGADTLFDITGGLTATNGNATFTFNILDGDGVSTIDAAGAVNIAGSALVINGNYSNILNNVLFEGSSVAGTFSSVLINGADGSSLISYGPTQISIIPEPTTVGLFIVSSVGLIMARRIKSY